MSQMHSSPPSSGCPKKSVVAPTFPQILLDIKIQVENLICDRVLQMAKDGSLESNGNMSVSPEFIELVKSIKAGKSATEMYNYCLLNHYRNGEVRNNNIIYCY